MSNPEQLTPPEQDNLDIIFSELLPPGYNQEFINNYFTKQSEPLIVKYNYYADWGPDDYDKDDKRIKISIKGKLTKWNEERGFGFVRPEETEKDIFVHINDLSRSLKTDRGSKTFLNKDKAFNEELIFDVVESKNKKDRAENVESLEELRKFRETNLNNHIESARQRNMELWKDAGKTIQQLQTKYPDSKIKFIKNKYQIVKIVLEYNDLPIFCINLPTTPIEIIRIFNEKYYAEIKKQPIFKPIFEGENPIEEQKKWEKEGFALPVVYLENEIPRGTYQLCYILDNEEMRIKEEHCQLAIKEKEKQMDEITSRVVSDELLHFPEEYRDLYEEIKKLGWEIRRLDRNSSDPPYPGHEGEEAIWITIA